MNEGRKQVFVSFRCLVAFRQSKTAGLAYAFATATGMFLVNVYYIVSTALKAAGERFCKALHLLPHN